ncbi:DUF1178 domain-containing protein [Alsobacter soli]|uniref:DUF1178 domain-containing protein n=1 Tax=Alsobacter soli TaxID=2109933 RepID=A0A2T1HW60_9HYPH|nr:DUF1178 family protein [Alsobacter soli]PSC05858.1 DUF1178 domain-containing protein [Alsobacter soli]
MIRYALACDAGHAFESWFRDSASFDAQAAQGFVTCPQCGSAKVAKQIMAPSVARTDRPPAPEPEHASTPEAAAPAAEAPAPVALLSDRDRAFRALLVAMREHVKANSEHVGRRFAEEARRMHEGVSEFRSIYGEATPEEAQALAEEGIEAHAMPWFADERN